MENSNETKEMVLDIVAEISYDIWKESYNKETAEEPDLVEDNVQKLVDIVNKYLYSSTKRI